MANTQVIDSRHAAESASFDRVAGKVSTNQKKELLKIAAELIAIKEALEGSQPGTSGANAPSANAPAKESGESMNPLFLLYEAVGRSQDSESQQQIVDAKTAEAAVTREEAIYYYWNEKPSYVDWKGHKQLVYGELGVYAKCVADWAGKGKDGASKVSEFQTEFNEASSKAQAAEGQSDGAVQSAQNQTSGDASNNQKMVQMIGTINTILSTTAQMLAQGLQ
jgi:hypothetical protein